MTAATESTTGDMPDPDETIRRTVRALRSAYDVDARVLARHLGIGRNTLYSRLNGTAPFLAAEVVGLAQFFDCEIMDFYTGNVRIGSGHGPAVATGVSTRWYGSPSPSRAPVLTLVSDTTGSNPGVAASYGSSASARTRTDCPTATRSAGVVNDANAA